MRFTTGSLDWGMFVLWKLHTDSQWSLTHMCTGANERHYMYNRTLFHSPTAYMGPPNTPTAIPRRRVFIGCTYSNGWPLDHSTQQCWGADCHHGRLLHTQTQNKNTWGGVFEWDTLKLLLINCQFGRGRGWVGSKFKIGGVKYSTKKIF